VRLALIIACIASSATRSVTAGCGNNDHAAGGGAVISSFFAGHPARSFAQRLGTLSSRFSFAFSGSMTNYLAAFGEGISVSVAGVSALGCVRPLSNIK
jgi:hypothetical protein